MVKTFEFPAFKVRLWFGEFPEIKITYIQTLERTIGVPNFYNNEIQQVCIEIARNQLGHPSTYGLLGAECIPNITAKLTSQVLTSENEGERIFWSLARKVDEVYSGLPKEYANAVLETSLEDSNFQFSGILRFNPAANAKFGSSNRIFGSLLSVLFAFSEVN